FWSRASRNRAPRRPSPTGRASPTRAWTSIPPPPCWPSWPARSGPGGGQPGKSLVDALLGELEVLHLARQVALVGGHVEVAMAAQRGQDHLLLTGFGAAPGLLDHGSERVRRLRGRDDALGPGEGDRGREALPLLPGLRLEQAELVHVRQQRGHAVVAQPAGVHRVREEVVAQGVHLQ